jgi:uncharacterized membrane protein
VSGEKRVTVREGELPVTVRLPESDRIRQIAATVDRFVAWLTRHWLAVFNVVVGIFVALPFLAPVLMYLGAAGSCTTCIGAGRLLYVLFDPTCHQLPERSFFLFGPSVVYNVTDLEASGLLPTGLDIFQRELLRFIGAPEIGYKVAVCERDVAIYGSILLSGLIFSLLRDILRRRGSALPTLPIWLYALLLVPIAVDGGTQLAGLRESDWLLRLITGGLFGAATVWLAYPYVEEAMAEVKNPLSQTGQKPVVGV